MTKQKRDYRDFLLDIINSIADIQSATKNLPQTIKDKDESIPWKKMAGMRDKIIHEYFGIDYAIVWKTAKNTLPKLKNKLITIQKQEEIRTKNENKIN